MRHFTDERRAIDMQLDFLEAQENYALASVLGDEKRSDFRLHNAWDIGTIELDLENDALHEEDRERLEWKLQNLRIVRDRIIAVERMWSDERPDQCELGLLLEEEWDIMHCGLGSHVAREILIETRRKMADPWVHPLLLAQVAAHYARSPEAEDFLLEKASEFAKRMDVYDGDCDRTETLYEVREYTNNELRSVLAYMREYDTVRPFGA